jgi:hypothetical protein
LGPGSKFGELKLALAGETACPTALFKLRHQAFAEK